MYTDRTLQIMTKLSSSERRQKEGKIHLIISLNKLWINKATLSFNRVWCESSKILQPDRMASVQFSGLDYIEDRRCGTSGARGGEINDEISKQNMSHGSPVRRMLVCAAIQCRSLWAEFDGKYYSRIQDEKHEKIYRILLWLDGMDSVVASGHIKKRQNEPTIQPALAKRRSFHEQHKHKIHT